MVSENALQIVVYLKQLEKAQEIKENFLSSSLVTGKMRTVLINWLAEVHLQFKLMQETLYLTVSIVDRYERDIVTGNLSYNFHTSTINFFIFQ